MVEQFGGVFQVVQYQLGYVVMQVGGDLLGVVFGQFVLYIVGNVVFQLVDFCQVVVVGDVGGFV